MPTSDRMMKNIILYSRLFELDNIIKEYESRLIKPDPVIKDDHRETK